MVEILLPSTLLLFLHFPLDEKSIQLAMSILNEFPWETIKTTKYPFSLRTFNID